MADICCISSCSSNSNLIVDPSRFRPLSIPLSPLPFSLLRRRRFSPKPLLVASISSDSPTPPALPRFEIVSSSVCADGSILFGFGEVGEEYDAREELRGKESEHGLCLSSVERNESLKSDCAGGGGGGGGGDGDGVLGASMTLVEKVDGSVLDTKGNSRNAVVSLGFAERSVEDLGGSGDNIGDGFGSESEMGNGRDMMVVGYRDSLDDVAAGLEFDGVVEDEKELGSMEACDRISSVEMANSMLCSELGVAGEVRESSDNSTVERNKEIRLNPELLQLSLHVEDIGLDENLIRLSTLPASLEAEQTLDPVEHGLEYRSSHSEMAAPNAPNDVVLLEVSDPLALEIPSTRILSRTEVPVAACFLSSGAALLPHPAKALTGLEDAYFLTERNLFGVADGAAQWSLDGIHAGHYAWELMRSCETVASSEEKDDLIDVIGVLKKNATAVRAPGLAAVLVAQIDNQVLHVANIGDTGFCLIRNGYVCNRSIPMVHEFNFPVRIGQDDDPLEVLEEYHVDIEDGDVIVVATDGLFDNLYEQEIVSIVSESAAAGVASEEMAKLLAARAQEVGRSASAKSPFADAAKAMGYKSPFADAAKAMGYMGYSGGKPDAVSVIVSLVQRRSIPE